jgi:hypothetical protein
MNDPSLELQHIADKLKARVDAMDDPSIADAISAPEILFVQEENVTCDECFN